MIVDKPENARYLPSGALAIEMEGEKFDVTIDESYVCAAAQFLIEQGFKQEVRTQAELVAEAINNFHWGLGANNYVAIADFGRRLQHSVK